MARTIPKNSKMNASLWKGLTVVDIGVIGVCIGILALIITSSLSAKVRIYTVIFTAIPMFMLFMPNGDGGKMYNLFLAWVMFKFVKKRYEGEAVKQFVPYTKISEDGLISYPTYFSKVLAVGQIEFSLLDTDIQDRKLAAFEEVLRLIGEDGCLDIVKIDRPLNLDAFSAELFKRIEECQDEVKKSILKGRIDQIDRINNRQKEYKPFFYIVMYDEDEKNLLLSVSSAKSYLNHCGVGGDELTGKETVNFLKYCHTRYFDEREIDDVAPENYADYILPKKLEFSSNGYKVDGVKAFIYTIFDYPFDVKNAWGADIFNIDNTKVVMKIRPVEKLKAIKRVDNTYKEISSREDNVKKASETLANETHLETMAETLVALQNENETFFDCTLTITAFNNANEDPAVFRKTLKQKIVNGGFKIASLRSEQLKAFLAANISRIRTLKRYERGINSSSLSAVFPFVSPFILDAPNGIILGYDDTGSPVALDITRRGGDYTNSNILILGQSGSGKSYFAKTISCNLFADGWRIFIFDVEKEFSKMADFLRGAKIDVGSAIEGRLNPFHIFCMLTDDGEPAPPEATFSSHLNGLEVFFKITLEGLDQNPDTLEYINNLVVEMYNAKGITEKTDCSSFPPERFPIFDDLLALIRKKISAGREGASATSMNLENLQRAELYISKFASGGRYSNLWNGASSMKSNSQLTVFNFLSLLANKNQVVANAQMLLVMRYIEQEIINTRDKNRAGGKIVRTLVLADEAHTFVDPKFPVALDFFYNMAKRIRKYAGGLCFITQNLADGMSKTETAAKATAIFANCQYRFNFQLPPQDVSALVKLYEQSGGINDTERHEISELPRGRCFLIRTNKVRSSFDVSATDTVEDIFMRDDERQL